MAKSSINSGQLQSLAAVTSYGAGILQAQAGRTIRRLTDESLSEFDLTAAQWFLIGAVHDAGTDGIGITELSTILGTNVPFVTNTVKELSERTILMRQAHEADKRARLIKIDPAFAPSIDRIERKVRENLRRTIYARVSQQELLAYINTLAKFNAKRD